MAAMTAHAQPSRRDALRAAGWGASLIAMMGVTQDLETIAKAQGGTAATYCKQIGDVVQKAAASLPK